MSKTSLPEPLFLAIETSAFLKIGELNKLHPYQL